MPVKWKFVLSAAAALFAAAPLVRAAEPKPAAAAPTFSKDIAPVLFENCVSCHRPGEVAPFPLTSYREAKKRAGQLAEVTGTRQMPPWKPAAGHGDFMGERRLTDAQVKLIADWSAAGAPEGDPSLTPKLPAVAEGWPLGEPDLIVKMTEAYTLRAEGKDTFRVFTIPLDLKKDEFVTAVEFKPGNRKIVHHALFFADATGQARKLDAADPLPGYGKMSGGGGIGFTPTGGLGGWSPGYTARHLPNGTGRMLRKGSDLVIQTHFHSSGKEETEQATVGLYFAKEPPKTLTNSFPKISRPLNIPAGEKNYVIDDTFNVPAAVTLIGITPHAHLLCKEVKVDAKFPDGTSRSLIWIKAWDWDWQDQYLYKEAIQIPAGTQIKLHYVYDNSTDNPKNPSNPPQRVRWGEQTTDEMAITFFQIVTERGGLLDLLQNRGRNRPGGAANAQ